MDTYGMQIKPDPQDAEDLTDEMIERKATEVEASISDDDWLDALEAALCHEYFPTKVRPLGYAGIDSHMQERANRRAANLRRLRGLMQAGKHEDFGREVERIMREQFVRMAEEVLS